MPLASVSQRWPGIEVQGLTKALRRRPILRGVDLVVPGGSVGVVEGGNGTGKTTLIRVLSTVLQPDEGWARLNGYDLRARSHDVRRSIGVAFVNDRSLYWRLDGVENLRLFARLAGLSGALIRSRIPEVLDEVALGEAARRPAGSMSTGQRQRLMLARALLSEPPVLLFDEPLRGLDDEGVDCVLGLVRRRSAAGAAVLVAAPVVGELMSLTANAYRLAEGVLAPRDGERLRPAAVGERG